MFTNRAAARRFIAFGLALALLAAGYYFWSPRPFGASDATTPVRLGDLQVTLETQPRDDRVFKDVRPELIARVDASSGSMLYNPHSPAATPDGRLVLMDAGDKKVKIFDRDGRHLCSSDTREGEGPGEFLRPIDLEVSPNDRIVVADARRRTLSTFDTDCRLLSTRHLDLVLHRLALTPPDETTGFLFSPPLHAEGKGVFYYFDEGLGRNFGRLLPESAPSGLPLDGYITALGEDMVYAPLYYRALIRYTGQGALVWARATVDEPVTAITEERAPELRAPVPQTRYTRGVSSDGERIYTYAYQPSKDSGSAVIDVYDPADGTYR